MEHCNSLLNKVSIDRLGNWHVFGAKHDINLRGFSNMRNASKYRYNLFHTQAHHHWVNCLLIHSWYTGIYLQLAQCASEKVLSFLFLRDMHRDWEDFLFWCFFLTCFSFFIYNGGFLILHAPCGFVLFSEFLIALKKNIICALMLYIECGMLKTKM